MPHQRQLLGQQAETLAAEFCVSKGWIILARNLRLTPGEIDILAADGAELVVVEVKALAKATEAFQPLQHLTPQKLRKLTLLASIIAARNPAKSVRIDAITVHWQAGRPHIQHIPNLTR